MVEKWRFCNLNQISRLIINNFWTLMKVDAQRKRPMTRIKELELKYRC